jgi:tetratricopeptide (TPR) repeat protein
MNLTPEDQQKTLGYLEYRNWALLAAGDLKDLQKGIDDGLAKVRTRDLLMQDALLKLRQADDANGRSRLLEILKSNPEDLGALDVLTRSYANRKELPAAIATVRMLVGERPNSAPLQYRLGALLAATRQPKEARAAYIMALTADPQFPPARLALAAMDQSDGKPDAARKDLDLLLTSKAGELPARTELSFIEAKSGNYAKAIEHLRRVVEAQPTNVLALNNLAYLLADQTSQSEEALKYAQKAKELEPNDVTVEGTLGWAYFQRGMYEIALQHLKDAVTREGKNVIDGTAIRRYHLAMAYAKTGDEDNASKTFNTALKLDARLPEAQKAAEMLGVAR